MKAPKPIVNGYSWLGILNLFFLQWFFVRLQLTVDTDKETVVRWNLRGFIVPTTGWGKPYKFVGRQFVL